MRVIIAGGGIGGMTAASALRGSDHEVVILEQASALREVGAGINLGANASRLLVRLGFEPALDKWGVKDAGIQQRSTTGEILGGRPPGRGPHGASHYQLYRPDLLGLLVDGVPGARLRLGHTVASVAEADDGVAVECDNGDIIEGDIIVGADGVHSTIRAHLHGPAAATYSGWAAYRGVTPMTRIEHLGLTHGNTGWSGDGRFFLSYGVHAGELMNWIGFFPSELVSESWRTEGAIEDAAAAFADWDPTVAGMIRATDVTNIWSIHDRDPLEQWGRGRVTLLGDAAHPLQPWFGQGGGMAIEDGYVLGRCLEGVTSDGAEGALRRYERLRQPRTDRVLLGARQRGLVLTGKVAPATDAGPPTDPWLEAHDVEDDLAS